MKRTWVIVALAVICVISFAYYWMNRPPEGVEVKGPEETMVWISIATSLVSLAGSLVGLALKLVDLRQKTAKG